LIKLPDSTPAAIYVFGEHQRDAHRRIYDGGVTGLVIQSVLANPYLRPNLTFEDEVNTVNSLRSSNLDVWKNMGAERVRTFSSPLLVGSRNHAQAILYQWPFEQFLVKGDTLEIEWSMPPGKKYLVATNTSEPKTAENDFTLTEGLVGCV
jgi:hypothetical protein